MATTSITLKEVFERLIALEAKIDTIDKANNRTMMQSISRFRTYSLLALFLIVIDIVIDLLHYFKT